MMSAAMADHLEIVNRHTLETLRLRRVRAEDGQVLLTLDGSLPPGSEGPPPHVHWHQAEEGVVNAGTLAAMCGGQRLTVRAGEHAAFPAGVVHAWWNGGTELLEFSGRAVPAGDLDRFLQGVFGVVNAGPPGRPPLFYLAHVLWRHRRTQTMAAPPRAVQLVLFPLIVGLGTLLGKYRGDDWPGAPARCPGAPEP
jgi:mannose-6-phosphate isomerase-like protein (cupin superfamily)